MASRVESLTTQQANPLEGVKFTIHNFLLHVHINYMDFVERSILVVLRGFVRAEKLSRKPEWELQR